MYHICSKIILAHVLFCQGDLIANLEHTIWVMTMIFWRYFPKPKIWRKIFSWSHRHGYRYDMIYIALRFWDMDIDIISGFGLRYGIWYYIGMKRYFTMTGRLLLVACAVQTVLCAYQSDSCFLMKFTHTKTLLNKIGSIFWISFFGEIYYYKSAAADYDLYLYFLRPFSLVPLAVESTQLTMTFFNMAN